jgi:HSP20 family protein
MRYRRVHHRYAVVLATEPVAAPPMGGLWHLGSWGVALAQARWRPPADLYETASAVTVTVELAGVETDDLDVLLFEDALVVEGQRRLPPAEPGGVYHVAQIRQGHFRLELPLPAPVDPDRATAHAERGLLRMTLPKTGAANGAGDGRGR